MYSQTVDSNSIDFVTHIGFVFERVIAGSSSAMKMSSPLSVECAVRSSTVFGGSKALETFLYNGRVFAMIIGVHLHIGCAYVHLITTFLLKNENCNLDY